MQLPIVLHIVCQLMLCMDCKSEIKIYKYYYYYYVINGCAHFNENYTGCGLVVVNMDAADDPLHDIIVEGCIPADLKSSVIATLFKEKRESLESGSSREIKLLEQPLKIVESPGDENNIASAAR